MAEDVLSCLQWLPHLNGANVHLTSITAITRKTALAEAVETIQPAVKAYSDYMQKSLMQTFADNDHPMGESASKNFQSRKQAELENDRSTIKSVREHMKPWSVIDEDAQDCARSLKTKSLVEK